MAPSRSLHLLLLLAAASYAVLRLSWRARDPALEIVSYVPPERLLGPLLIYSGLLTRVSSGCDRPFDRLFGMHHDDRGDLSAVVKEEISYIN